MKRIFTLAGMFIMVVSISPVRAGESNVEIAGPQGPLAGTLVDADGDGPAAVLIPGSGPTDRDGNNRLGVKAATLKLLAEGLAEQGISSVRIDKRGMFGSAKAIPDANDVTLSDYGKDAADWAAYLAARTDRKCAWLIGHSEGGLVALKAASSDSVCGLVLVATPGRAMGELIRTQLRANPANAPLLADAESIIDRLERGERVPAEEIPPPLLPLFNPKVQNYLIDAFAFDPVRALAGTAKPVLVIQGGLDIQVSMDDAERLRDGRADVKLAAFDKANHVLKPVKGEGMQAQIASYADPDLPLTDGIVDSIAGFLADDRVR